MSRPQGAALKIKRATITEHEFTYETFRLTGRINGQKIRKQFKSRDEAEGEKNRLEVQAANGSREIRSVATHLSTEQVRLAEAAFASLGSRSMPDAIQWYDHGSNQVARSLERWRDVAAGFFGGGKPVRPDQIAEWIGDIRPNKLLG